MILKLLTLHLFIIPIMMDYLKRSGADCETSFDCLDFCIEGKCTEKKPNDETCDSPLECWGTCINGRCEDMRMPGDSCNS